MERAEHGKKLHRHLEMGKDGRSAAEDSATELTLPILVATICILIVYLPIMFFSGIISVHGRDHVVGSSMVM